MTISYFLISTNGIIFFGIISAILISIGLIRYYSNSNKVKRKLKQYSNKKISQFKENEYAKVSGKAYAINEPLLSPFGKTACVYYQIEVQREKSDGEGLITWKSILKDEESQDFILEADSEKAIVTMQNSKKTTHIIREVKYTSGTFNSPPKFIDEYLKSRNKKSTNLLGFNKTLRYVEGVIEIGKDITVLGIGNWKESDHKFDHYSSKNLYLSGDNVNNLIITNDPKIGQ